MSGTMATTTEPSGAFLATSTAAYLGLGGNFKAERFGTDGLGFRVEGLGFGVENLRLRV